MVVDMLTSAQEPNPSLVPQTEEDGRISLRPEHHGERHLHSVPHASVLPRCDDPGALSTSRSSRTTRMNPGDGDRSAGQQRMSSEEDNMGSHGGGAETRRRLYEDKTRSCKRKLELPSLSSGSCDATEAQGSVKKDPESPPPAKRWVIGPLFQSFKSKMASFTEIVMSPVRLFKPSELPVESGIDAPVVAYDLKEDVVADGVQEKVTAVAKPSVVQRLSFDTNLSDVSDSEQNKDSRRSTSQVRETVNMEEKQICGSVPCADLVDCSKSVQSSPRKGLRTSADGLKLSKQAGEDKSHDQDQSLGKKLRLPTPAVGKRKEACRGLQRRGLAETLDKESASGTDDAEESPSVTLTSTVENLTSVRTRKRRRAQVLVESLDTGEVQIPGVTSAEKEETGQTRASRSRSRREKDVVTDSSDRIGTNFSNDSTPPEAPPSSGSVTGTSSRTTRQQKSDSMSSEVTESLRSGDRTSESKPVQKSNIRQAKHKSVTRATEKPQVRNTRRVKRTVDTFEDQGMSMSLTLKVGSGLDGEKDPDSIVTCGITTQMGEDLMVAGASRPSRLAPENDDELTDGRSLGRLEKEDKQVGVYVYVERVEIQEDRENDAKRAPASSGCGSNQLKRSLSCPDIASLQNTNEAPVSDETLHRLPLSPLKRAPRSDADAPSPVKRTRRHTVCSVEIEREIAPLCLRKEVYPKWGGTSAHSYAHSPSKSFASLISCFLSSPLAFLSKKSSRGHGDDSGYGASTSDLCVASSSSSPSPPSLGSSASCVSTSRCAFFDVSHTSELSSSVFDGVSTDADDGAAQQERNASLRSSAVSEEKALSDSEIKTDGKQVERRKVSSIRIRKTLPKPQYNLTPMGLPKAVRLKKKVFSVEEIYTNKNFIKPLEGRLETIFEVPLSRRDGSQSLIGPKRMKRFVEFPELGVARKPRRPLVGGAGGGGAQRKAAGSSGVGRTRRGREEVNHLQDFDSLLCEKLSELDLWMVTEQMVY